MNHYETLGVTPEATPEDIKRAFRKKASEAHPDREGGSTEQMQAVNKAWEVLGDPQKRAHFDATGQDQEGPTVDDEARNMLMHLFGAALDADVRDVLANVRQTLELARANLSKMQSDVKAKRERLVKRTGKVKAKTGENLVQMLIDQKCNDMAEAIQHMGRGLMVNQKAQEMLKDFESDPEPVFVHSATSAAYNVNGPYAGAFFGTNWPL